MHIKKGFLTCTVYNISNTARIDVFLAVRPAEQQ